MSSDLEHEDWKKEKKKKISWGEIKAFVFDMALASGSRHN